MDVEQFFHYTEVTTAVTVVSSIVTFAEVGRRIIRRVNEFVNDNGDVPGVLADVKAKLQLVIEKMDQLKSLGEERPQKIEPQSALTEAVIRCISHVDRLEILVNKLQPSFLSDSWTKKVSSGLKKASQRKSYEGEISKILIILEGYKTSFDLQFTDISIDLNKVTTKEEAYYMVPCLQISYYVQRLDLLESVKSAVQQRWKQQLRQVVVLLGMAGQGKSQLAMEYCRIARLSKEFRAIFWIDASSIKSAYRSFERIASNIADPSIIFENIGEKVAFVKDTIDGWHSRWLLVFDNYDTPSRDFNVAAFFPSSLFGTILVTSRHEDSKRLGKVIPVAKMTEQESLVLLFLRSENELTDENIEIGKSIVAKLQFLPLAMDQAGAFISAKQLPMTLFLECFELQKEEILNYTPSLTEYIRIFGDDEKESALNVFTTWELSFQQIPKDETGQRLRLFLTTAAFFNSQDIGEDLFHSANDLEAVPLWINAFISKGRWDSIWYRKFVTELSKLSLLNFAIEDMTQCRFYLHRMIADWLKLRVSLDKRRQCTIESCYLLAKLISTTNLNSSSYAFRLYLLEHVDECLTNRRAYLKPIDEDVRFVEILIDQFGKFFHETSRFKDKISLVEEALPIIETAYGNYHASTLDIVSNLGILYHEQGKLVEAEEMLIHALVRSEKALGKDHVLTLNTIDNLGILYHNQGKLIEVEEMLKRVLVGRGKAFGEDHILTLNTVDNLGILYHNQGKLVEAKEMHEHALAARETVLGKDHESTLTTINNLGNLYQDQGKLAEAEKMLMYTLVGREKTLGKDHVLTLNIVDNLGILYRNQGKLIEAEKMHKRAFVGREKALGIDHASTITTINNLGILYHEQGKLIEAKKMYKQAIEGYEKVLGRDHKLTLDTVCDLAKLKVKQEDLQAARQMFERACFGYTNFLDADNFKTIDARQQRERISPLQRKKVNTKKDFWESLRRQFKTPEGLYQCPSHSDKYKAVEDKVKARKEIEPLQKKEHSSRPDALVKVRSGLLILKEMLNLKTAEFITAINNGRDSGYFVSKAWMLSLDEHEDQALTSFLRQTGYLEIYETDTTVFYEKISEALQVSNSCNANIDLGGGDTNKVVASSDNEHKLRDIEKDFCQFHLAKKMKRSDFVDPEVSTSSFQNKMQSVPVQNDQTAFVDSPKSLLDKGKMPLATSNERLESFKRAINDTSQDNYSVSTQWITTLSNQERENLNLALSKAGYLQIDGTSVTTYFERLQGHVRKNPNNESESSSTLQKTSIVGGAESSRALEGSGGLLTNDRQHPNIGNNAFSAGKTAYQESHKREMTCPCHPQHLMVSCLPEPSTSSSSQGEYISKYTTRKAVGDSYVTMPKNREGQLTLPTGGDKTISLRTVNFGDRYNKVSLKVSAATSLRCCIMRNPNDNKVLIKFSKIRGEVEVEDGGNPKVNTVVLRSVRCNVDAYIIPSEEPICIPLEFQERDRVLQTCQPSCDVLVRMALSGQNPRFSEIESRTIELQCDVKNRLRDDKERGYHNALVLQFAERDDPVILEGNILEDLDSNMLLEFNVRYQVVISYNEQRLPPAGQPFVGTSRVDKTVDFDFVLHFRTSVESFPHYRHNGGPFFFLGGRCVP